MPKSLVVYRRELKSYFLSPIAYVFGVLFLGVQMWFSTSALGQDQPASMVGFFQLLGLMLLFFVPALTMRLWAEERKLGTLELLMTFPVRAGAVVFGKFSAALTFLAIVLLLTVGLPLTLAAFGSLDWGPVLAAYCGALLMAGAYLSVGMLWSSLTRDQIVALLLALVSLLGLYFIGWPRFLSWLDAWVPRIVLDAIGALSPYQYFRSMSRGVIDSRDVIYYLVFTGVFLYGNVLVLQYRRHKG